MATHTPGTLHPGGVVPGTVHQDAGRSVGTGPHGGLHTEHNTNTYDSRTSDTHTQREVPVPVPVPAGPPRSNKFSINKAATTGLALTQLLTLASFLVAVGGLAALQRRANNLTPLAAGQQSAYSETFQSGNQIPYTLHGSHQFGFQWYILAMEILITLVILAHLVLPRKLLRLKHIAMALLAYVFVLTTLQVESLLYFRRSPAANALFGRKRILITLIGTMAGCIANGLSIIFLGLLRNKNEFDDYHNNHGRGRFGGKGKRVGADYQGGDYATGPAAV